MVSERADDGDPQQWTGTDRRGDRRIAIRLPVECRREEAGGGRVIVRTITQDVSSGGMYLELDSPDFNVGDRLEVELTVPPAEGVSPYQGRARCAAEVLRVRRLDTGKQPGELRYGVATRFLDRLRFSY
ncbi:MAG: PilZ domain-containing protein [Phycisphaerae bacterium]